MDAALLNTLRDPAGVPFYPVVFQGLYILTWALHAAFVLLSLGSMAMSLVGMTRQKSNPNWKLLTGHLIQTGKISVSLLIVLGVAPLLFTQVIYDPNWYTVNALSGVWVVVFIYTLIVGYSMYYWYYYANKAERAGSWLIGLISFLVLLFAGVLMHMFSVESIQPDKWMSWYAPGGHVDTSGLNFHIDPVRLLFMVSLAFPVTGIFLQNYSQFLRSRADFTGEYLDFVKSLGTKLAIFGFIVSAVLFVAWMLQEGLLFNPLSLLIVLFVVILLLMSAKGSNSYFTTGVLVIAALLISGLREYIKFSLMSDLGYDIYDYTINFEWPSIIMFLLTFLILGVTGVTFIATMAWKVGKTQGIFDASKDAAVSRLANVTVAILVIWCAVYLGWGMFTYFKNVLL